MKFSKVCSLVKSVASSNVKGTIDVLENRAVVLVVLNNHELRFAIPVEDIPSDMCKRLYFDRNTFSGVKADHLFAAFNDRAESLIPGEVQQVITPKEGSVIPNGTIKNYIDAVKQIHDKQDTYRDICNNLFLDVKKGSVRIFYTNGKLMSVETIPAQNLSEGFYNLPICFLPFLRELVTDKKAEYRISFDNSCVTVYNDNVAFSYKNEYGCSVRLSTLERFVEKADSQAVLSSVEYDTLLSCAKDPLQSLHCEHKGIGDILRFDNKDGKLYVEKEGSNVQRVLADNYQIKSEHEFDYMLLNAKFVKTFTEFLKKEGRDANLRITGPNNGLIYHNSQDYIIIMPLRH